MLGKIEGGRRSRPQRMRWLDDITDSMDMSLSMLFQQPKRGGPWSQIQKIDGIQVSMAAVASVDKGLV